MYPVVCKSFELAFLKEEVDRLLAEGARFLEVAIGEGTFSARVFPRDAEVVGLDLSPYSLQKAVQMPHVRQAVVCDCLRLPIGAGHFDVILANNFLHHVTMKGETLARWSKISRRLILNENTPFWASGWTAPFVSRKLGASALAQRLTDGLNRKGYQYLEPKDALDDLVRQDYDVVETASYVSEPTFLICSMYSFIMNCAGLPTPRHLKDAFLSASMRWMTLPLTTQVAKALIQYDQYQDRARDTFVSYVCESRHTTVPPTVNLLLCPRCGGELSDGNCCKPCRKPYSSRDGMLFLLPEEMEYIETGYDSEIARSTPREHL